MKKYIELSILAEGGYSGATYEESVFITEEIWDKIGDNFNRTFYKFELDGKHSCCECDFEEEEYTEQELSNTTRTFSNDGNDLYYRLCETMKEHGYENPEDILGKIEEEIENIKVYEEVKVKVKKENKDMFMELVKLLQ